MNINALTDNLSILTGNLRSLTEYLNLGSGWDGERASEPNPESVFQAMIFLLLLRDEADLELEPSLHVDGSVILEANDGSFWFIGDGNIAYYFGNGLGRGVVHFDSRKLPDDICNMLTARHLGLNHA